MKDGNSLADYLHFLNIAQSSLGELGSGIDACHLAGQLGCDKFNELYRLHYEVENKLLKLIESLQKKSIDETLLHFYTTPSTQSHISYLCITPNPF